MLPPGPEVLTVEVSSPWRCIHPSLHVTSNKHFSRISFLFFRLIHTGAPNVFLFCVVDCVVRTVENIRSWLATYDYRTIVIPAD